MSKSKMLLCPICKVNLYDYEFKQCAKCYYKYFRLCTICKKNQYNTKKYNCCFDCSKVKNLGIDRIPKIKSDDIELLSEENI